MLSSLSSFVACFFFFDTSVNVLHLLHSVQMSHLGGMSPPRTGPVHPSAHLNLVDNSSEIKLNHTFMFYQDLIISEGNRRDVSPPVR